MAAPTGSGSRRAEWLGRACAIAFGLLLALVLMEGALRWLLPEGALAVPIQDGYWLRRQAGPAGAPLHAIDLEADPDLGWRMKPGFAAPGVNHGPQGFRVTRSAAAGDAPLRILALGDSFAYGLGVGDDETFEALLAARPGVAVTNAGVNGYGVDQAVLTFERHGRSVAPRIVTLTYFVDDFFRNGLAVREGPKPRFVPDPATGGFQLLGPQASLQRALEAQAQERSRLRLAELAGRAWSRLRHRLGQVDEEALQPLARTSRHLLQRLHEAVRASGATLVVMFIGHAHGGGPEHRWVEAEVMRSCRDLGIDCLDMVEEMAGPHWREYYLANGHWSALGHRVAAETLARHLAARGGPEFAVLALPPTAAAR